MFRLMKRDNPYPIHTDKDFDYVMGLLTHIAKKGETKWFKPEHGYIIGCRVIPVGTSDNQYYFIYEDKDDGKGTDGSSTGEATASRS